MLVEGKQNLDSGDHPNISHTNTKTRNDSKNIVPNLVSNHRGHR